MYLVRLKHATVRTDGKIILKDISWHWKPGESWGIIGTNGTGKTTFLRLVRGEIFPENYDAPHATAPRLYFMDGIASISPIGVKEKIGYIGPELRLLYRKQRWDLSARDTVASGFFDSNLLYNKPTRQQWQEIDAMLETVGMQDLAPVSIQRLSQGQAARVLLARALVGNPQALILDEVCDGLDANAQEKLMLLLREIQAKGVGILYAAHDIHDIPEWIDRILVINDGTVKEIQRPEIRKKQQARNKNKTALKEASRDTLGNPMEAVFYLDNVDIFLGKKQVLKQLSWVMQKNENWVITGKNGAGKSTLLRLLYGGIFHAENGGKVFRFGKEDGNLWDIRENIGYVSYEMQADFSYSVNALETVALGKRLIFGQFDILDKTELNAARQLMRQLGLTDIMRQPFSDLSHGQRRIVFIARALINKPKVLLLDEPMSGLDQKARSMVRDLLTKLMDKGIQLVIATHHPAEDLPNRPFHHLKF